MTPWKGYGAISLVFSWPGKNRHETAPIPLAHAADWRHSTRMNTETEIARLAQRISFGAETATEDTVLLAAAAIFAADYIPSAKRPERAYVGPHLPGRR